MKRPNKQDYDQRNIMYPSNYQEALNEYIDHLQSELEKVKEENRKMKNGFEGCLSPIALAVESANQYQFIINVITKNFEKLLTTNS